jgi:hypothetical protein
MGATTMGAGRGGAEAEARRQLEEATRDARFEAEARARREAQEREERQAMERLAKGMLQLWEEGAAPVADLVAEPPELPPAADAKKKVRKGKKLRKGAP